MKIEQLDNKIQKKIIELKVRGLSNQAIADEINLLYKTNLTANMVNNYTDKRQKTAFKLMKEKNKLDEKLAEQYFNSLSQLNKLNSEMWEFFYESKKEPELKHTTVICPKCNKKFSVQMKSYSTFLKTAEHLLKQIEHVDKVLGRLQKKQITIKYNYLDLSRKLTLIIPKMLEKLEKQGYIKIKKKKKLKNFE